VPKRNADQDDLPDLDDDTLDPALTDDTLDDNDDEPDDPDNQDDDDSLDDDQVDLQGQDDQRRTPDDRTGDQDDRRPARGSRENDRIRTLTEEVRRRDEQLAATNRRLDELTQRVSVQPQGSQETQEQRATRLALMSPEDRIREEVRESSVRHERDMRTMAFQLQDTSDRASFSAKATVDPLYRKWETKVEEELASLRAKGQNVGREQLFYYMIGKAAIDARGGKESKKTLREANARVRNARVRTSNSRSDSEPAQRSNRGNSLEKRLEDVPL